MLIKKLYKQRLNEDISKLTKKEMLKLLEMKIDIIDKDTLKIFIDKILLEEYKEAISSYSETVSDEVEKVLKLIKQFELTEDEISKKEIYKQIVKSFQSANILISEYLPKKLVEVIKYGFEIKDVHGVARLMKARKEMLNFIFGYEVKEEQRGYGYLDSQTLYKEFIAMIVENCDQESSTKYLKELSEGKYLMLEYVAERFGWKITQDDIINAYGDYKLKKSENFLEEYLP